MKYFKVVLYPLSIVLFFKFQTYSQFSSFKVAYTNDFLQGDQFDLSVNKGIRNLPFSFEAGIALTLDFKSYNIKSDLNYYLNLSEVVNFSAEFSAGYAFFIDEFSGDRQMATYI